MIKVFSHWIHWKTIVQVVLDIFFPVACVFLAVLFWGIGEKTNLEVVVIYALIYALVMVVFNSWLGLYSRAHTRTDRQRSSVASQESTEECAAPAETERPICVVELRLSL